MIQVQKQRLSKIRCNCNPRFERHRRSGRVAPELPSAKQRFYVRASFHNCSNNLPPHTPDREFFEKLRGTAHSKRYQIGGYPACEIMCPCFHECAALFQGIAAPVCLFGFVSDDMRYGCLRHIARQVYYLACPKAKLPVRGGNRQSPGAVKERLVMHDSAPRALFANLSVCARSQPVCQALLQKE